VCTIELCALANHNYINLPIITKIIMTEDSLKPYVIGLDLGGTNSVFGIVDSRGDIKATTAIKTQGYGDNVEAYVDASIEALKIIIDQVGGIDKIKAMGIGAPNGNYYNGTIEFAPNLEWGRNGVVPLAKLFSDKLGIPVALTNDANAAAIGEMTYGVARGMKNFIVITLGTGVGSGIVINGQLVYGCDGFAGELGHVIVKENGRQCGCGRKGCLETYCSATGVARSAREFLANSDEPSLLRELDPEKITSYDVAVAAGKGDKIANEIFEFTGKILGEACADFAAFSSPEAFIFFGGLTKAGDLIMNPIKKAYDETVLNIFKGKAKFLVSGLEGSSAAVLGASAVGWDIQD
jgi:glucokinase